MKVTIPVSLPTTRKDGVALTAAELSALDAFLSTDGGQTFTKLPGLTPASTSIVIDGMDPGTDGIVESSVSDTQSPPAVSAKARVTFSVPVPRLADPSPPTLGAPVIS